MITVLTRPVQPGVLATISGTLDHEGQVDALTGGLACLSSDGTLIIDLSGVVLAPARIVQRLADGFGDRFAAGDVRVVASRLSARLLLDRAGVARPVFASVADAIDHQPTPVGPSPRGSRRQSRISPRGLMELACLS